MIAALIGTRIDRNTIIKRMNDSPTTDPMKSGSRLVTLSLMSMNIAVCPPT